ncbi:uncharacterized protein LOC127257543 isoform X2 [Andrographis paniculata]|uniref:uncharacterized protein LOC127257543 isoform X2 n=1 Tax=Andrographis paniculata TaxID=175694 RepID=UPI0021E7B0FF|nr:uncharacterized protein LOC127257543 isoform X2 [Andrographis paniculata]
MASSCSGRRIQRIKFFKFLDKEKVEIQRGRMVNDKMRMMTNRRGSSRERKIALQQDVDKLKKKLRHEENVHRALERAFTRPPGALPRLPPYLPPDTLELLAEVAVLEEEVVRLEERVVHFRQGLYQEAVYISSSKKNMDGSADFCNPDQITDLKSMPAKSLLQMESNVAALSGKNLLSLSDEKRGKENQSSANSSKNKQQSPNSKLRLKIGSPLKNSRVECGSVERQIDANKLQFESNVNMDARSSKERNPVNHDEVPEVSDNPNKISENMLKCLMSILVGMTSLSIPDSENLKYTEFKDPYGISSKCGKLDIGSYKNLLSIDASSIKQNQTTISIILVRRLKFLLEKLASVELKGLSHQEKLAFWINLYNSCMMNIHLFQAFIEYGIPESPEKVVTLMQKATINVGGHILNAITIEHFILRLPYHSKHTFSKGAKHDDATTRSMFSLELSEPLVTFALSCGSWSSPAVRVYTASEVEHELEAAKREYLQAAIGISTSEKLISIPKLLDWYLLDFAKDLESLLDWICLQLPYELRKELMKWLEMQKDRPLRQLVRIMPYEFNFRYLLWR